MTICSTKTLVRTAVIKNCRILLINNRFQIKTFDRSPEGTIPEISDHQKKDPAHRARIARKIVAKLLSDGFRPSQIAILSHYKYDNNACCLKHLKHVDNIPVKNGEMAINEWLNNEVIFASTIKSFKGMDADIIIATDIPATGCLTLQVRMLMGNFQS